MLLLIAFLVVLLVVVVLSGWVLTAIISAAIVGAVIGGLARLALPGRQNIGVIETILLGWIGSLIGSVLGRHVFHRGTFITVLIEIAVAAVLVALASAASGTKKEPARQS